MKLATRVSERHNQYEEDISSITKTFSDYYHRFRQFCSFYPLRERHLADSILNEIRKSSSSKLTPLSVLDVGSAGGELLGEIIHSLRAGSNTKLDCVAVEPDPTAFARLETTAMLLQEPEKVNIDCIHSKIEYVLTDSTPLLPRKFDYIICSHVFYHLVNWAEVINNFFSWINSGGLIIVILDSHNSPIYEFRKTIETKLKNDTTPHKDIQEYGDYRCAEEFTKLLESSHIPYSSSELQWKLAITTDHLKDDLMNLLTFLFRFRVSNSKAAQRTIQSFADRFRYGNVCIFPWEEMLFTISKESQKQFLCNQNRNIVKATEYDRNS